MARKGEVKKIRPSEAVRSMELYNEKVFALIHVCGMALDHSLVDAMVSDKLRVALDEVKEFHNLNDD